MTVVSLGVLMLLATTTAFAGKGGAESPAALLTAMQKASAGHDVVALVHLIAPSQLETLALQTDMAADLMAMPSDGEGTTPLETDVAKLRKKYGVVEKPEEHPLQIDSDTPQEVIDAHIRKRAHDLYGGIDVAGYTAELTKLLLSTPEMGGRWLIPEGKPGEIQVDGDHATVRIGDQDINFLREDGRWYMAAPGG